MGPGCIRSNSDGIIRDLLFMHIERGHLHVVLDLLDFQTMDLKNLSGTTVTEALLSAKNAQGMDIDPILKKLEALKTQKLNSHANDQGSH